MPTPGGRETKKEIERVRAAMSERDERFSRDPTYQAIGSRLGDVAPERARTRGAAVLEFPQTFEDLAGQTPPEYDTGPKPDAAQAA